MARCSVLARQRLRRIRSSNGFYEDLSNVLIGMNHGSARLLSIGTECSNLDALHGFWVLDPHMAIVDSTSSDYPGNECRDTGDSDLAPSLNTTVFPQPWPPAPFQWDRHAPFVMSVLNVLSYDSRPFSKYQRECFGAILDKIYTIVPTPSEGWPRNTVRLYLLPQIVFGVAITAIAMSSL